MRERKKNNCKTVQVSQTQAHCEIKPSAPPSHFSLSAVQCLRKTVCSERARSYSPSRKEVIRIQETNGLWDHDHQHHPCASFGFNKYIGVSPIRGSKQHQYLGPMTPKQVLCTRSSSIPNRNTCRVEVQVREHLKKSTRKGHRIFSRES